MRTIQPMCSSKRHKVKEELKSIMDDLRTKRKPFKQISLKGFLFWRRHPDLNWGIEVLQTSALPLGYVAKIWLG